MEKYLHLTVLLVLINVEIPKRLKFQIPPLRLVLGTLFCALFLKLHSMGATANQAAMQSKFGPWWEDPLGGGLALPPGISCLEENPTGRGPDETAVHRVA